MVFDTFLETFAKLFLVLLIRTSARIYIEASGDCQIVKSQTDIGNFAKIRLLDKEYTSSLFLKKYNIIFQNTSLFA